MCTSLAKNLRIAAHAYCALDQGHGTFSAQRYVGRMNSTSSSTSVPRIGLPNSVSSSNLTAVSQPGRQGDEPANRKERRRQAKIQAKEVPAKFARYIGAAEMQKLAGKRARQHLDKQRQGTAEQPSASSTNASFAIDEAAIAGPAPDHPQQDKFVVRSWPGVVSLAVSGAWKWVSGAQELKTSDEETKEAKDTKEAEDLARYADLVGKLRENGVKKIFLAEQHWDPENVPMIAGAISGANRAKKQEGMTLYREMGGENGTKEDEDAIDSFLRAPRNRSLLVRLLLLNIVRNSADATGLGVDMLRSEITSSERVKVRQMSFLNPDRMDMREYLKDEDFAMASCGLAHALYKFNTDYDLRIPWTGLIIENPLAVLPHSHRARKDMFDGFEKAQRKTPTAVILQSEVWDYEMTKEDVYNYYNGEGLVVVELPLNPRVNATIIAPPSTLSMLQKFAREHDGHVWILCKGIEGCDTPEAAKQTHHDEF
jgi:hypothetical protein